MRLLIMTLLATTVSAAEPLVLATPDGLRVLGSTPLDCSVGGWGPKWSWIGFKRTQTVEDGVGIARSKGEIKGSGATLELELRSSRPDPRQVTVEIAVSSDRATELTMAVFSIAPPKRWAGELLVERADGSSETRSWPVGKDGLGAQVRRVVFTPRQGSALELQLDPPQDVPSDGDLRVALAKRLAADEIVRCRLDFRFAAAVAYYPSPEAMPAEPDRERWFVWQPSEDYAAESAIGMADWQPEPAGSKGRITREGDQLRYGGEPIVLWGLNNSYGACAPPKEEAERRAAFYAKYGVNSVRLHKYADGPGWAGIQSKGSFADFDPEALDRMDYFVAQLKAKGIFVKLSPTFGIGLGPDDYQTVPYAGEWGAKPAPGKRTKTRHGAVFLSRELQDLQIQQTLKLLAHVNPYTGLSYAQDPAIAVVELYNEDSALFFGTQSQLQKIPTLRQRAAAAFTDWLLAEYGSEQALLERWGERGLNAFAAEGFRNESVAARSIVPGGNPWFYDPDQLGGDWKDRAPRLHDTMRWLYLQQNAFYDRYVEALRGAGYDGEILASNWQAGRAFSHYYNLHSDWRIGMIDRHNYFGGGGSMLRVAGGGILSAGMQQVADRPFMLSEWIHVFPNQWGAEGPAIIGAYGMGLQGWDVSYLFQNGDDGGFSDVIGGHDWDVTAPQIMGLFPAVARQVRRGDVAQGEVVARRKVHLPSLAEGRLGFDERVEQQHDIKTFTADVAPAATLAVGRSVVEFTAAFEPSQAFDPETHRRDGALVSTTGQLRWYEGDSPESGSFTIASPGTAAVVGFAAGTRHQLGPVTIAPQSRFGAIYVTAQSAEGSLAQDPRLLVVAIGRAHNRGMRYIGGELLQKGEAPIEMEPVVAEIALDRAGSPTVHVCDHDGRRTGRTVPVTAGRFIIDGRETQTVYYEIVYP